MNLSEPAAALKASLEAKRGAVTEPVFAPRGSTPLSLMFKVSGKLFAVLSVRGAPFVILKCDQHLAEILREQYAGVGHRSHLDRRYWISVSLDADVPSDEIERMAERSYELVRAALTRKQKADMAAFDNRPVHLE